MRREQESWTKDDYIGNKRSRSTKKINKISTGRTGCTIVVAIFSLCTVDDFSVVRHPPRYVLL
jgi:hypothetical protein